jgi:hypothetical protein
MYLITEELSTKWQIAIRDRTVTEIEEAKSSGDQIREAVVSIRVSALAGMFAAALSAHGFSDEAINRIVDSCFSEEAIAPWRKTMRDEYSH